MEFALHIFANIGAVYSAARDLSVVESERARDGQSEIFEGADDVFYVRAAALDNCPAYLVVQGAREQFARRIAEGKLFLYIAGDVFFGDIGEKRKAERAAFYARNAGRYFENRVALYAVIGKYDVAARTAERPPAAICRDEAVGAYAFERLYVRGVRAQLDERRVEHRQLMPEALGEGV